MFSRVLKLTKPKRFLGAFGLVFGLRGAQDFLPCVAHDNEGSDVGFRTLRHLEARQTEQPHSCKMDRP